MHRYDTSSTGTSTTVQTNTRVVLQLYICTAVRLEVVRYHGAGALNCDYRRAVLQLYNTIWGCGPDASRNAPETARRSAK
jgi:hypothetical protein